MRIGFVHDGNALLPEIDAYISFFSTFPNIKTFKLSTADRASQALDVEWIFMGTQQKKNKDIITIHEYASASTPPFGRVKNFIKKRLNAIPDFRIFFSDSVYRDFSFTDEVPFGFRGHDIMPIDLRVSTAILYDFIYVGTTNKSRNLQKLFECFRSGPMHGQTLLVLSNDYHDMSQLFQDCENIIFKGPVPYADVYSYIRQARFGINYITDKAPYNRQVSSKLIDYAACKIPVVSTGYDWVRAFQKSHGGAFFYLNKDLSNFTWHNVCSFNYTHAEVGNLTWENQIKSSGVVAFLEKNFPGSFN